MKALRFSLWLGSCLLLFACSGEQQQAPVIPVPQGLLHSPAAIEAGARLFQRHCRECHGSGAEGRTLKATRLSPSPPDFLDGGYAAANPAYLYHRIATGKHEEPYYSRGSAMPAFGPYFRPQQIWQLVAYLRSRAEGTKIGK